MRIKQALAVSAIFSIFILLYSCSSPIVSRDNTTKQKFQTVVFKKEVLKKYLSDPSFKYFILRYDPVFLGGIQLEVTAFNNNGGIMDKKIKLEKLKNSEPNELVNMFDGYLRLSRDTLEQHGVDASTDYVLTPQPYRDSANRVENYVSYHFDRQIKAFYKDFSSFTLDPSPPYSGY